MLISNFILAKSIPEFLVSLIYPYPSMVTLSKLPISLQKHCVAGNNAHYVMQRGYIWGQADFVGRNVTFEAKAGRTWTDIS